MSIIYRHFLFNVISSASWYIKSQNASFRESRIRRKNDDFIRKAPSFYYEANRIETTISIIALFSFVQEAGRQ